LAPLLISLLLCWQNTMTGQKRSKTARLSGNKGVKHSVFKVFMMSSNQGQVVNSREVRQPGCQEVKQSSSQYSGCQEVKSPAVKYSRCQEVKQSSSPIDSQIVRKQGSQVFLDFQVVIMFNGQVQVVKKSSSQTARLSGSNKRQETIGSQVVRTEHSQN